MYSRLCATQHPLLLLRKVLCAIKWISREAQEGELPGSRNFAEARVWLSYFDLYVLGTQQGLPVPAVTTAIVASLKRPLQLVCL
jgi:hypothetical protein